MKFSSQKIAAIYARISDDKTGEGLGVARQIEDCEQLAARVGLQETELYIDNDISAFSGKRRPEYRRMLEDIASGRVGTVITWHNDRLYRSLRDLADYVEVCEAADVPTLTVRAGDFDLSTAAGHLMATQLASIAIYESKHRSERIKRKTEEKAKKGEYHGGAVRPFGFEADGVTHRQDEADEIRSMTEDVISGRSLGSIIRDLNSRNVTSVRGKEWTYPTLRALLLRPRNAGLRQHQGQVIGDASWEPIVARDDFSRVERILNDPARKTTRNNTHRHLLSGIAKCGVCGKGMKSGGSKTRTGTPFRVYRCCTTRNMTRLDELVIHCLKVVLANQVWEPPKDLGAANAQIRLQLELVESKLQEAALAYTAGKITMKQLSTINTEFEDERQELESHIVHAVPSDYDYFVGLPHGLNVDELPLEEKRSVIRALFSIKVLPVGKGSNKRGITVEDGVDIDFLGDFITSGAPDLESTLWGARLNPSQVRTLRRAVEGFPDWQIAKV